MCDIVEEWGSDVVSIWQNFPPEATECTFAVTGLLSLLAMQSALWRVYFVCWISHQYGMFDF